MAGKQFVQCVCGNYVELRKGFFGGWQKAACSCGEEVKMSNSRMKTMHCDTCQIDVACDITKPCACPICKKPFQVIQAKPLTTRCPNPNCGAMVTFFSDEASVVCPVCDRSFDPQKAQKAGAALKGDSGTMIRCGDTGSDWSIVKVERSNFPVDAMVELVPGATAFVVVGNHVYQVDEGNRRLEEMSQLMDYAYEADGRRMINCNVYYVRNKLDADFVWGAPLKAVDRVDVYDVIHVGQATIAMTNPRRYLEWMNYRPCKIAELSGTPSEGGAKPEGRQDSDRIWNIVEPCFQRALDQTILRNPDILVSRLNNYPQVMLDVLQELANNALAEYGMAMKGARFTRDIIVTGHNVCGRVECELDWTTSPISVRARDRNDLYATLVLGGSGRIRVADVPRFLSSSDGQEFTDNNTTKDMVARKLSERIGRLAGNQFEMLLHSLIQQTDTALDRLGVFSGYCADALMKVLNDDQGLLGSIGLSVQHMTVEQKNFTPSPALRQSIKNVDTIATMSMEEELRKFAEKVAFDRKADAISMSLELNRKQTEADIAAMKLNNTRVTAAGDIRHSETLQGMRQRDELEKLAFDQSYAKWQREDLFAEARAEADIRRQMHAAEVARITALDMLNHERTMDEVTRAIENARLDWKQKKDDYDRMSRLTDRRDEIDQKIYETKATAEAEYFVAQKQLQMSSAVNDELEKNAQREEDRADRIRQAEFARDLTIRQLDACEEMTRFQQEMAQKQQLLEAEKAAREQTVELEKLKLTLEYMTKVSADQAAAAQYRSQKEYAAAMAEKEYARLHAQEEQQRREREEKERNERIERDAQRADDLVRKVLEAQKTLETLKLNNEHAYLVGLEQARKNGYTPVETEKLEKLTKAVQELVNEMRAKKQPAQMQPGAQSPLGQLMRMLQSEMNPAQPQAPQMPQAPTLPFDFPATPPAVPQQPAAPYMPFAVGDQPGVGMKRRCPHCGKELAEYSCYCDNCHITV